MYSVKHFAEIQLYDIIIYRPGAPLAKYRNIYIFLIFIHSKSEFELNFIFSHKGYDN